MNEAADLNALRDIAFLNGISQEHLEQLGEISSLVEFPARKEIFRERDRAQDVYIIKSGRVSLVICAPKVGCRQLMEVSDGDLIGWSPVVGRSRLTDTAVTITPTVALRIETQHLLDFCRDNPRFGYEFMQRTAMVLAERLTATRLQLLELSGSHLPDIQIESD